MAAASLLPLLPIKIHRHASFNKSNLFCSFKSSHTLHSRLSTVSRICSSSHVGLDSGEEELDNSSIPSTESRWKSIGKRKVAMRVGYVGTNYRGLQIQRDSGSIMKFSSTLGYGDQKDFYFIII